MENIENLVEETENVEQTTEETVVEPVKTFTQEEVNAIVGKNKARTEAKIRREYEKKYGDLHEVLKAGTGKEDVGEITNTFRDFYTKKGIQFAQKPQYNDDDVKVLAQHDAESIINSGYDEVVEEVDRLADIGFENMNKREKALFKTLAEHRQNAERGKKLSEMGVTKEEYESKDFKDFASQFNATTPIDTVYDIYRKTKPKKEIRTMGSMKQTQTQNKDYYTPEEIERLTLDDLNDPKVWDAVRRSMTGQ